MQNLNFKLLAKKMLRAVKLEHRLFPYIARIRFQQQAKRRIERCLPETIVLELTNKCNLRCVKCPTYETRRAKGFMEKELYTKVLRDIERAGVPVKLGLSGAGESLLHPQIVEFVKLASQTRNVTQVGFATNGLLLSPQLSKELLDSGLGRLKLSLDMADRETYFRLNRVDGYQQVVDNFREFCRIKKEGNYDCEVTLKVTMYKKDEALINKLHDLWDGVVDNMRFTRFFDWLGLRGNRPYVRTKPCTHPWDMIQILWNGQITLCCYDTMEGFINMGNVQNVNIAYYWLNDPQLKTVRRAHMRCDFSNLKICSACSAQEYEEADI